MTNVNLHSEPALLRRVTLNISVMVELGAVLTGILITILGRTQVPVAQAAGYGLSALVILWGTMRFMDSRGVSLQDVWVWDKTVRKPIAKFEFTPPVLGLSPTFDEMMVEPESVPWWQSFGTLDGKFAVMMLRATCFGIALGFVGWRYTVLLDHLPFTAELVRKSQETMRAYPKWRRWYALMAVGFAPLAEEYLFRGLLFRPLDREWDGWKAVAGSAAFFAIYHPLLAWPMIFCLGALNAVMFKRTGRLATAVVPHMLYNAAMLRR